MDTRLLLEDLNLQLKEPEQKLDDKEELDTDSPLENPILAQDESATPSVQVSVDAIKRPDTVASGSATFKDGETLSWQIDTLGRLGLIPKTPGYKPDDEALIEFQKALTKKLEEKPL